MPIKPPTSFRRPDNAELGLNNDIRGGTFIVDTIVERNAIPDYLREWNCECTVRDDNKKYSLVEGENSNDLDDNLNWVELSSIPAVDEVTITIDNTTPSNPVTKVKDGGIGTQQIAIKAVTDEKLADDIKIGSLIALPAWYDGNKDSVKTALAWIATKFQALAGADISYTPSNTSNVVPHLWNGLLGTGSTTLKLALDKVETTLATWFTYASSLLTVLPITKFGKTAYANRTSYTATAGSTINPDFSAGNVIYITVNGNFTLGNPTNVQQDAFYVVHLIMGGTGSHTISYGNYYDFGLQAVGVNTNPILYPTIGARTTLGFTAVSTTMLLGTPPTTNRINAVTVVDPTYTAGDEDILFLNLGTGTTQEVTLLHPPTRQGKTYTFRSEHATVNTTIKQSSGNIDGAATQTVNAGTYSRWAHNGTTYRRVG